MVWQLKAPCCNSGFEYYCNKLHQSLFKPSDHHNPGSSREHLCSCATQDSLEVLIPALKDAPCDLAHSTTKLNMNRTRNRSRRISNSMPLAPCGWRCRPHRHLALTGPLGNLVNAGKLLVTDGDTA